MLTQFGKVSKGAESAGQAGRRRGHLEMRGVTKRFGRKGPEVLQDITLTAPAGEFVVVVGPSGCGKSTLLNIAAGMVRADDGAVTLDGQAVTGPGPQLSMVFQ